jgi:hypothetical protein
MAKEMNFIPKENIKSIEITITFAVIDFYAYNKFLAP